MLQGKLVSQCLCEYVNVVKLSLGMDTLFIWSLVNVRSKDLPSPASYVPAKMLVGSPYTRLVLLFS